MRLLFGVNLFFLLMVVVNVIHTKGSGISEASLWALHVQYWVRDSTCTVLVESAKCAPITVWICLFYSKRVKI